MSVKRKNQFTFWLKHEAEDCGIMQPPLNAQKAVHFLRDYLLGEDWYVVNPVNTEQCNAQIVHEILMKYSSEYRKEYRRTLIQNKSKEW
jgi:hypothetical protein